MRPVIAKPMTPSVWHRSATVRRCQTRLCLFLGEGLRERRRFKNPAGLRHRRVLQPRLKSYVPLWRNQTRLARRLTWLHTDEGPRDSAEDLYSTGVECGAALQSSFTTRELQGLLILDSCRCDVLLRLKPSKELCVTGRATIIGCIDPIIHPRRSAQQVGFSRPIEQRSTTTNACRETRIHSARIQSSTQQTTSTLLDAFVPKPSFQVHVGIHRQGLRRIT